MSRRRSAAAVVLTTLVAAAGCAGAEPGVVAYVGPTRITQTQLDSGFSGLSAALGPNQPITRQTVVNLLIAGEIAAQVAAERGIAINDAARNDLLRQGNLGPLLDNEQARPLAYDFADQNIVLGQLGEEAFVAELGEADVTLNPRFGTLNPQTKQIEEGSTGSLSVPLGGS